ncbi:hypothetical protein [Streptomyces acidiscabies]|uniref:Uncharacterized protein n=1 Tax=Streptomyces acidiscabies TaxID=42234 RepID=A0AAP6B952_9ACTN|nr:hypothetical protein [Streptomyces acidiscabies]MBP5935992.1 hypothetical protein [Streptomyces sp. LBUM 1476]MBZ3916087.1 hypothetical protein [Streptomyces acidiscabies]MDX2960479.1 hypothetical protein [Streptomyces acidiscabies]MDX3017765.1 hypothetical protein [Streptomyces acidiscabies]MDX3794306.1 hypothetical protein [Streptomyces acidiscabies]
MTRSAFAQWAFLWGLWTCFEALFIGMCWQNRTRVLGEVVYRIPGVKRFRHAEHKARVRELFEKLGSEGDEAGIGRVVDRWHQMVVGRRVSACLQAVPLLVVVLPAWWMAPVHRDTVTPAWMVAAIGGLCIVSILLVAADQRAVMASDPAGEVAEDAFIFLELLLVTDRSTHGSAQENHRAAFSRLCRSLRAQTRHMSRGMPREGRKKLSGTTDRLIAALSDADHRYLFTEGGDREAAVQDLSRLVSDVMRRSCESRATRTSLVIVDDSLTAGTPAPDPTETVTEPLVRRLLAGVGRLVVAAGLFAGAYVLLNGGVASGLLATAGLVVLASAYRPLWDALPLVGRLFSAGTQQAPAEVPAPTVPTPTADTR